MPEFKAESEEQTISTGNIVMGSVPFAFAIHASIIPRIGFIVREQQFELGASSQTADRRFYGKNNGTLE